METLPQLDPVAAAIVRLAERLAPVESEICNAEQSAGRVLAKPLTADRDSPACDVSAMDGYAIRLSDLTGEPLPVVATAAAGFTPETLTAGTALRIFTGAAVPSEADCVIPREQTLEAADQVKINVPLDSLRAGQHIRRRGENIRLGQPVLESGTVIQPSAMGAIATFSLAQLLVYRRVRVVVLNTGDELAGIAAPVQPWQIRDSNGPLLEAWLRQLPWVEFVRRQHVGDTLDAVKSAITAHLPEADAILLTGGVSMGDADFVPAAVEQLGGETVFHRLPIRPGKPVLGASLNGKLLLGLPGNPVSVAVTSRVIGLPLLRKLAGIVPFAEWLSRCELADSDERSIAMTWYRLVRLTENSQVQLLTSQGSGDLVSLSTSQGFIELPAGAHGRGPWRVTWW